MSNVTWRDFPTKKSSDQYYGTNNAAIGAIQGYPRPRLSSDGTAAGDVLEDAVLFFDAKEHQNYNSGTIVSSSSGMSLKTIRNLGWGGSILNARTGSTSVPDTNDPLFLDYTGTQYVYLPGVFGNALSVTNSAALQITGDIDLRAYIAPDSWVPSSYVPIIWKILNSPSNNFSYALGLNNAGRLLLGVSLNGTTLLPDSISTVSTGFANGVAKWVRVTRVASTGTVQFFTSDDGVTWTQLGTDVSNTSGNIYAGTSNLYILSADLAGGGYSSYVGPCKVFRAQIFNGIDGTKVLDIDTSTIKSGWDQYIVPQTYSGQTGAYFTGSGLSLPGTTGNYASAPDSSALDITGDIDLRVKVSLTDWTPSTAQTIMAKYVEGGNQRSYSFGVSTTGTLSLVWTADGASVIAKESTVVTGITDGTTKWVRVTLDVNNGASGNNVEFYTSDDGITWTKLGATVTTSGITSLFSGTASLEFGSINNGTKSNSSPTIYRAQIRNGIDGTVAFDANFESVPADSLRMTESSTNAAIVTLSTTRYCVINRSTSGRKSVAVTAPCWLLGTDDYLEVLATATGSKLIDVSNHENFSVIGVYRYWPVVNGNYKLLFKGSSSAPAYNYTFEIGTSGTTSYLNTAIGGITSTGAVATTFPNAGPYALGDLLVGGFVFDRISSSFRAIANQNTTKYYPFSNYFNFSNGLGALRIGRLSFESPIEFMALAIWRRALSESEVATIVKHFRERYP